MASGCRSGRGVCPCSGDRSARVFASNFDTVEDGHSRQERCAREGVEARCGTREDICCRRAGESLRIEQRSDHDGSVQRL